MLPILSVYLVIAGGVFTAAAAQPANQPANQRQVIQQIIHTNNDGTSHVETHSVDAAATTATFITGDGKVVRSTSGAEKQVLIEMQARPLLDRKTPGSPAHAAGQRRQLARDLDALDKKRGSKKPSRIKREYHILFSGVSATVDAAAIKEIRKLPNVVAVHEDTEIRAQLTESVPLIGAPAVHGSGATGIGVKVAIIDTGIDYTHPDLGGCFGVTCKVAGGYDYVNDDGDPADDNGHGTHVAGIVAANGTVKGVAPGATLLAYKVLDSSGYGWTSDIVAALEQAVLDGAKVANLSLGGAGNPDDPTSQAVDNATAAGLLSVAAAGNTGPSFQTIESPGTARTALTVGATDKSWNMAFFSSRGFVADGDEFLMKPELVAPGVDIRSTVPVTGQHGDPSRYKLLSGTSMATPHAAGSAALLLQWRPALTPSQLKERLMNAARALLGAPFTEGAGALDVSRAFGGNIFASPSNISFGVISAQTGIVIREQTITVRNTSAIAETVHVGPGTQLPAGVTMQFIPPSVSVPGSGAANVTVRLTVDTTVTPEAPDPMAWSTGISVVGLETSAYVPAYFFRGSVLELTFEEAPWFVYLISAPNQLRYFTNPGNSLTVLVKAGAWDVLTAHHAPMAVVLHEQQNVQGATSLHITRAQANRLLTMRAVDDTDQPLREFDYQRTLALAIDPVPGAAPFGVLIGGGENYKISDVSSRYVIGIIGGGPDVPGDRVFTSSWVQKGNAADVTLPTPGVPFRRLEQRASVPPGASHATMTTYKGFAIKQSWGSFASTFGTSALESLNRTLYFQSGASADVMLPLRSALLAGYTGVEHQVHVVNGPYFLHEGGSNLTVSGFPWFHFYPSDPDAVLGAAIERWDLETAPNSLPLRFVNSSTIRATGHSPSLAWVTHTAADILRAGDAMPAFDLYRAGAFVGTYTFYFDLWAGISSAPGAHELRSSSDYAIGGTTGTSRAVISFDTTRSDPNPPAVTMFRIEQNGVRTPAPLYRVSGSAISVKFRVTDDVAALVTMEWRHSGSPTWTPLPLAQNGNEYEGFPPMSGSVELRLTATDPSSNVVREEWAPAYIASVPPPPTTPALMTASRTGASAITVSWGASSSPIGIASYSIERLPGNIPFIVAGNATTFVDTNVVNGNAYFYRVLATDTNNVSSLPTSYDVASLVQLDDDPLIAGSPIRGVHMSQMRRTVDAIRYAAGLAPAWTNYDPPTGLVRASDFAGLRDRLNEARSVVQLVPVSVPHPLATGTLIHAADLQNIRNGVK
ncbi:MAG TPA: S8 family serine peptidase [Thermoanaerobaculia bacterium]|nr:S8 family serine peptidase [Thermoanaerobaculia bacterium]